MKQKLKIICIIGIVIVVSTVGNYTLIEFDPQKNTTVKNNIREDEVCAIDKKYLEFYGITTFTSNLPVIMIDTDDEKIIKEHEIWGTIGVIDGKEKQNSIVDRKYDALLACTVKLRGASSYSVFDKPQFRLKLYRKENGKKYDYPLCGLDADSEWVLNGPFLDKTAVRNSLIYHIAQGMNIWSPNTAYAEVFVNGEYQGLYVVTEPVTETYSRLGLSDYAMFYGETAYILKRDRIGTESNVIETWGTKNGKTYNQLSVSYPSKDKLTLRQKNWIKDDISKFEEVLYSEGFDNEENGYAKYIDVDSFVDYYIINEVVLNHDAGLLSTYAYKDLNGKLKMAIWDYNNSYDNYQWFEMKSDKFYLNSEGTWFSRLLQDKHFVTKVVERYKALRKEKMNIEFMYNYIDQQEILIQNALDRNDKVWGYSYTISLLTNTGDRERNYATREEAISQLKEIIQKRFLFLDEHITDLYQGCIN